MVMDNSVYVVLSKQLGQFRQMAVHANNVANANTTGFKPDFMLFIDHPVREETDDKVAFAQDIGTYRDHAEGAFRETGNPLDVALHGNAYFVVQTALGERYTRAGNFQLDANNTLVTAQGYPVLDAGGQNIVFQEEDRVIEFADDGTVIVDGEERGQLDLASFPNEQMLERAGGTLFKSDVPPGLPTDFKVVQGVLEDSGVKPVVELTDMITTMRRVSSTSKFIEMSYELQRKASDTWAAQN